jgi:CRISPR-associated protein Csd2
MSATVNASKEPGSEDAIRGRVDFVLIFSAEDANPNGDPGYDNRPRTDAFTGTGYVTDVCLKRKIRNRVEAMKSPRDGYDIWVRSGTYLRETIGNTLDELRKNAKYKDLKTDKERESLERRHICSKFFDIRAFGGVLTSDSESIEEEEEPASGKGLKKDKGGKPKSKVGQIRGPVSIQYAKSIAPIVVEDDEITRVCPTNFDPKKPDKKTEMGRKKRVPFAVYVAKGSVSARLAEGERGTGFANADLKVLRDALRTLFVGDESTARPAGSMIVQKLVLFTHNSKDGDEPVHKTLGRVKVNLKPEFVNKPQLARSMEDYGNIGVDKEGFSGDVDELDAFQCNFMEPDSN